MSHSSSFCCAFTREPLLRFWFQAPVLVKVWSRWTQARRSEATHGANRTNSAVGSLPLAVEKRILHDLPLIWPVWSWSYGVSFSFYYQWKFRNIHTAQICLLVNQNIPLQPFFLRKYLSLLYTTENFFMQLQNALIYIGISLLQLLRDVLSSLLVANSSLHTVWLMLYLISYLSMILNYNAQPMLLWIQVTDKKNIAF